MRYAFALLAAALVAGPVVAQAPAPGTRQIKLDVSPAGEAVLKKYLGTPDPGIRPLVDQLTDIGRQLAGLADLPKLDLARVQTLMRRQESLQATLARRGNDRTLAMLTELPEPDRIKFLRGVRAARAGPPPAK